MAAADYRLMTEATGQRIAAALEALSGFGDYLTTADVVNNLTSTATDKPLSAAQGKALNDKMVKQATITVQGTTAGLIPFTGIAPTNIVSATSNGYVIMPFKINTGAWRGLITDQALNIVTSQPTITVDVLYY